MIYRHAPHTRGGQPMNFFSSCQASQAEIFDYTLTDDDRRAIIDRYPAVEGLRYTPPNTLPQASRKFSRGQAREDTNLKNLQYAASGILRPLDVLAHNILKQMPHKDRESTFTILNHIRALVLNLCGAANNARNEVAFQRH